MGESMITLGAFKKFLALCGYPQTGASVSGGGIAGLKSSGVLKQSAVSSSVTGTLTETVLATIPIPAGAMGVNGQLRIWFSFTCTNSANIKTFKVNLGGVTGWTGTGGAIALFEGGILTRNRGVANSQLWSRSAVSFVALGNAGVLPTTAVDMTAAQNLTITGTLANTGETITLEGYTVEILNP